LQTKASKIESKFDFRVADNSDEIKKLGIEIDAIKEE